MNALSKPQVKYTNPHSPIQPHTHKHVYTYIHTHTRAHTHSHIHEPETHTYKHTHIHTLKHTHTYTHTHKHSHTQTHKNLKPTSGYNGTIISPFLSLVIRVARRVAVGLARLAAAA